MSSVRPRTDEAFCIHIIISANLWQSDNVDLTIFYWQTNSFAPKIYNIHTSRRSSNDINKFDNSIFRSCELWWAMSILLIVNNVTGTAIRVKEEIVQEHNRSELNEDKNISEKLNKILFKHFARVDSLVIEWQYFIIMKRVVNNPLYLFYQTWTHIWYNKNWPFSLLCRMCWWFIVLSICMGDPCN